MLQCIVVRPTRDTTLPFAITDHDGEQSDLCGSVVIVDPHGRAIAAIGNEDGVVHLHLAGDYRAMDGEKW